MKFRQDCLMQPDTSCPVITRILNGVIKNASLQREALTDDSFYILINAHHEQIHCTLPDAQWSSRWQLILATDIGWEEDSGTTYAAGDVMRIEARSLSVLRAAGDEG